MQASGAVGWHLAVGRDIKKPTVLYINRGPLEHNLFWKNLAKVLADQFGHFKHADGVLTENSFEFGVRIDVTAIFCILKVMLLDVLP